MSNKPLPKYLQLKREIMAWIETGRIRPDEQIPTEQNIAEQFGISRQTVRQTLGDLEQEGWLYRIQGKGTFVSQPKAKPAQDVQMIGMITTYISDYIFPHIVRGAEAELRSRGFSLMLSSTDNSKEKERESLELMLGGPVKGLIVEPTKSAEGNPNLDCYLALNVRNIPFVMINERYPELDCPCIKQDDESGGYKAVEHLVQMGHRDIAGFFKTDDLQGVNRLKGFLRGIREFGLPLTGETVVHYTTEEKHAKPFDRASAMLRREERPTAFVCYNDELAVQLLEAARRLGVSVPDDISLIGFDDSTLALATEVKLTTLTHPKTLMGEKAAELLMDLIEKRKLQAGDILFSPELVIRDSVKKLVE